MSGASRDVAYLRVEHDGGRSLLVAPVGAVLRDVLLANDISPYSAVTERLNCGGRGLCATCGVRFVESEPDELDEYERTTADPEGPNNRPVPDHWHDRLAARFGYPRLSCQIEVEEDMHLRIPEKVVWGSRRADEAGSGDERA